MSDSQVVERNWRGQYPPVAILQNTRRALSASAHSAKRDKPSDRRTIIDLAFAYQEVLEIENYIRQGHQIELVTYVPTWVHTTMKPYNDADSI